jgi:plasmid segregation protein ParM
LTGHHDITFHKPDGTKITRKININKVRMMPQPLGSIFNLLMDDNGKIVNKELAKQKVGVVDIGFRTTDFSIFDQLRYVERGSTTTDTGISKSFGVIAKKLREECGVSIEVYRLYKAVQAGVIKIRGKEYNIAKLRDQVFSHAAGVIANDIERLWAEDWDMDTIVLTGGGSMELADYLQPLVVGNVIPIKNDVDARINNVQGYYKYGKYEWDKYTSGTAPATEE